MSVKPPYTVPAAVAAVALAGFLLFPSAGIAQKYLHTAGAFAYLGLGSWVLIEVGLRAPAVRSRLLAIDRRWVPWAAGLTFAGLVAAFVVLYPLANAGSVSALSLSSRDGGGSDRDESLNLGAAELLAGRYPYSPRTHLGNPVTQMPGALLLAVPFRLLGNAAWQNLFWMAVFVGLARWRFGDTRLALGFLWLLLLASPVALQDFVTGGDLGANSIMVLTALLLLVEWVPDPSAAAYQRIGAALFTGVAFSSRLNFLLLAPLLFAALARRAGARAAAGYLALAGLAFAAVTLPFWWHDPAGFAPLRLHNKFALFDAPLLPGSGLLFPGASLLFALLLACRPGNQEVSTWLMHCGLVQALPLALAVVLASAWAKWPNFTIADYGPVCLYFGALGAGLRLFGAGARAAAAVRLASVEVPEPLAT